MLGNARTVMWGGSRGYFRVFPPLFPPLFSATPHRRAGGGLFLAAAHTLFPDSRLILPGDRCKNGGPCVGKSA